MKSIILLSLVFAISISSEAQLLKKLKEKAGKVLDSKAENSVTATTAGTSGSSTSTGKDEVQKDKKQSLPPENGSVIFSMTDQENLMYDESRILAKNDKLSYLFVIRNNRSEYFLVEDGKRTGPFKTAPVNSVVENAEQDGDKKDEISLGNDRKDATALKYSKTINGKLHLVFNGKNFGPYDYVSKMIVSPNEKQFFALVTIGGENNMTAQMGMGYTFIVNEAGLKQKVGSSGMSMPYKFSVSEGFTHSMATALDQKSQELITVSTTGKEEKASMASMYSDGGNKTLVNDKGDIITVPAQSPTQVLVNGKEAAAFKVPIKSMNRLFLTPDVSKSVYYEEGKIYRADGTEEDIRGVLFPKVVSTGNETAVYYFKIYKAESGSKDVYLCKKVI